VSCFLNAYAFFPEGKDVSQSDYLCVPVICMNVSMFV